MVPGGRAAYAYRMTNAAPPTPLRFVPVPEEIAERARRTMKDAFGHSLHVQREHGPCRICLRIASEEEPEDFILLSYQPLADRNPYAEIGPISCMPGHVRPTMLTRTPRRSCRVRSWCGRTTKRERFSMRPSPGRERRRAPLQRS